MHIRTSRRRRGDRVYEYIQLVQSYRRPDGMPAHKVLASLGSLSPLEVANLRSAVAASRQGVAVVLPEQLLGQIHGRKVKRNLRYLDIAVALRVWEEWGLAELVDDLAPHSKVEVSAGAVTTGLVIQRCVAPNSKLAAAGWYADTALPELQGVSPTKFNNTRIHRVLEILETIEVPLQERLARRIDAREGQFVSLFLDCTDTWFEGHGPDLAHKRVDKEGILRKLIGIALLCDQRGYPLRWATLPGNHNELQTMLGMIQEINQLPWAQQLPLVVDRAMGRGVTVGDLLALGVRFITAVPVHEIASYGAGLPLGKFDNVVLGGDTRPEREQLAALQHAALEAGFDKATAHHYVLELGLVAKGRAARQPNRLTGPSRAEAALRLAQRLRAELDAGVRVEALAARVGCHRRMIRRWLLLLQLNDELQHRIFAGEADRVVPSKLERIAKLPEDAQAEAFEEARKTAGKGAVLRPSRTLARLTDAAPAAAHGVLAFNPRLFLEHRHAANEALDAVDQFVDDLNRRLRSPRSRRGYPSVLANVTAELERRNLKSIFSIEVDTTQVEGRSRFQVRLQLNANKWARRRRTDGFTLIVAHPDVLGSAADLVRSYFAKDLIEKDFQTIKSVLKLRPLRHRTDPKVRAHVTLCMLALFVERSLEHRLRGADLAMTANAALSTLGTCCLNLYHDEAPFYSVTSPTPDQARILAALGWEDLADDDVVTAILTPR